MKKAFKIIYYVCLGFLGVIAIILIASVLPITGNFKVNIVLSGSMEPVINKGGIVVVKPENSYRAGDIITFQEGKGESVTHRIVEVKNESGLIKYSTKGDANNAPDRRDISAKYVIGKVIFDIPYLGYVISFVQKPLGFMLLIIIPALAIIGDEIKKIYVEIKKRKTMPS